MLKELDKQLKRKIKKYEIPGASVAVLHGSRIIARAAAGVVNLDTKVPATTDTLFQIGSITKPITATRPDRQKSVLKETRLDRFGSGSLVMLRRNRSSRKSVLSAKE